MTTSYLFYDDNNEISIPLVPIDMSKYFFEQTL